MTALVHNLYRRSSRVGALTLLFFKPALRQPMVTLIVVLVPVAFILIFSLIGGASLRQHALYGTLVVFSTNVGVVSLPQIAVAHRARRLRDMFVASPVGPASYAVGLGLSRLAWVAPGLVLLLILLTATGGMRPSALPTVGSIVILSWLTGVVIGFTLALVITDSYLIGQVANLSGLLLSVLPPVYYPLAMVPEQWRWLPMLVPTTHAAQLIRIAAGVAETTTCMVLLHWAILIVYGAACIAVMTRRWRWRET